MATQEEKIEKMKQVVEDFSNVVNSFSDYSEPFIEAFERQHRTLQQSMFGCITRLVGHMATEDYRTDGRNEQSKKVATAMLSGIREMYLQQEVEDYQRVGYSPEQIEEKSKAFRDNFDKDPKMYLGLACV
jgi:hypothetical protein